jgi:hypothetical protein
MPGKPASPGAASGAREGEDVLQAELTLRNESGKEQAVAFEFATSARPYAYDDQVWVHSPLSAIGLENPGYGLAPLDFAVNAISTGQVKECDQASQSWARSSGRRGLPTAPTAAKMAALAATLGRRVACVYGSRR